MRDIFNLQDDLSFISDSHILSDVFNYVSRNNKSNNAPYHNLKHMVSVMKHSYEIAINGIASGEFNDINIVSDIDNLLVAALFHDFNHSMGKFNDIVNVKTAIESFDIYYSTNEKRDIMSSIDPSEVTSIIKATQYPYVIEYDNLTTLQKIIRDADLMVSCDVDFFYSGIYGLMEEMGITDIDAAINGQLNFHKSIKLNTDYCRSIYADNWYIFDTIKKLKTIIK